MDFKVKYLLITFKPLLKFCLIEMELQYLKYLI